MTVRPHLYAGSVARNGRVSTLDYETSVPYSPDEFLTVTEAAQFAKCSETKIRNLYRDHRIARNVLGKILISKSELLKHINGT